MKKICSLFLLLALLLALLPVGAMAYSVVLSPQNLTVDGKSIDCEKYNIDGSNYFKLRDIAYLLKGTASEFGVDYDAAANAVVITPGIPYDANGSELVTGADKSATAVPSAQTVLFRGAPVNSLNVYNIGGNNFFKLRDLGELIGFTVDYDAATNTAIILTGSSLENADYQSTAFDAIWAWLEENKNVISILDSRYDWEVTLPDGRHCKLSLVANDQVPNYRSLRFSGYYYNSDGTAEHGSLYLERDRLTWQQGYNFFYFHDIPANDGTYTSDFSGRTTIVAPEYSAGMPIGLKPFLTEEASAEELAAMEARAIPILADMLYQLETFLFTVMMPNGAYSIADFGFVPKQLGITEYGSPSHSAASTALTANPQAEAFDAIFAWVQANANDSLDGYPAYYIRKRDLMQAQCLYVTACGSGAGRMIYLYYDDAGVANAYSAFVTLTRGGKTFGGGYTAYTMGSDDNGERAWETQFFGRLIIDPATLAYFEPVTFYETEGDVGNRETSSSGTICDMLTMFDDFCQNVVVPSGQYSVSAFGFDTYRISFDYWVDQHVHTSP